MPGGVGAGGGEGPGAGSPGGVGAVPGGFGGAPGGGVGGASDGGGGAAAGGAGAVGVGVPVPGKPGTIPGAVGDAPPGAVGAAPVAPAGGAVTGRPAQTVQRPRPRTEAASTAGFIRVTSLLCSQARRVATPSRSLARPDGLSDGAHTGILAEPRCGANALERVSSCASAVAGVGSRLYGRRPNTATPLCVPTKTLPPAMVGVMNLLPAPKWSRPPAACELL